jgi:hypothetical protein
MIGTIQKALKKPRDSYKFKQAIFGTTNRPSYWQLRKEENLKRNYKEMAASTFYTPVALGL